MAYEVLPCPIQRCSLTLDWIDTPGTSHRCFLKTLGHQGLHLPTTTQPRQHS